MIYLHALLNQEQLFFSVLVGHLVESVCSLDFYLNIYQKHQDVEVVEHLLVTLVIALIAEHQKTGGLVVFGACTKQRFGSTHENLETNWKFFFVISPNRKLTTK